MCFHGNLSISSRVTIGMQLFIAFHYNTFYYVKLLLMSISDFSNLKFLFFFFLVTWSKSLPLFYLSEEQSFVCLFCRFSLLLLYSLFHSLMFFSLFEWKDMKRPSSITSIWLCDASLWSWKLRQSWKQLNWLFKACSNIYTELLCNS